MKDVVLLLTTSLICSSVLREGGGGGGVSLFFHVHRRNASSVGPRGKSLESSLQVQLLPEGFSTTVSYFRLLSGNLPACF